MTVLGFTFSAINLFLAVTIAIVYIQGLRYRGRKLTWLNYLNTLVVFCWAILYAYLSLDPSFNLWATKFGFLSFNPTVLRPLTTLTLATMLANLITKRKATSAYRELIEKYSNHKEE